MVSISDEGLPLNHPQHETVLEEAVQWLSRNWDPALTVGAWWSRLAESGWGYPSWPVEYFGRGLPMETIPAVREAFARVGALGAPNVVGQRLGIPTLLAKGTEAQKRQFIPALARGEEMWCQFFSEPGAGSDLAGLQTRATRDGDGWRINGQKVWSSYAHFADRGLLMARTDPTVPKHAGITYFIIDIEQPGVTVRPLRKMNGHAEFNEVFFDDAYVSADRMVGTVNGGWDVALTTLNFERFPPVVPRSAMPGRRGGQLDKTAGAVAAERGRLDRETVIGRGFPQVAADWPATAGRLDAAARDQDVARLYVAERLFAGSAQRQDRAGGVSPAGSVRKLARSDVARTARDVGAAVRGAGALLQREDDALAGLLLSAHASSIAGGTDEIQHNIIGERVLGLPKEARNDARVPFNELTIGTQRRPGTKETGKS